MPAPVLQFKRGNAGVAGTVPALRPGEPAISLNNFDFFVGIDTSVANNKFFGSHRYWGREDGTTSLRLKLVAPDGDVSKSIHLKSPNNHTGVTTYTFPSTPDNGKFLSVDGSGNLSWQSVTSGASFTNSTLSGITTISGSLSNTASTTNSGVTTFTNTTDNTLGNANTGAVQIDGGLGVEKNLTVGANLNVQGYSEFVGVVTFKGGTINIGDGNTDDINVGGEFISGLFPNTTNTYDLGDGTRQWRHGNFAGILTASTGAVLDAIRIGISGASEIDTSSGNLTLDSATGTTIIDDNLEVYGNINCTGNVSVGGTTITLRGTDVFIENKDIVLGYTTSITPNDDTANHAGVAIASTIGTPLVNFDVSGINTLPNTYKQLMWFKSGTLGFSTDAFAFNYGVAIGTTTMANGIRLAVGSGITMSDTSISATNFYGSLVGNASSANQVKTVTASDTNATYHITFVDANNGSATNETVYTDDGIYYNPGTNTFTTQHANFTGNVNISGITTLAGNITLGDAAGDAITINGTATFTQGLTGTISTATNANNINITQTTSTDTVTSLVLVANQSTGFQTAFIDSGLSYNANGDTLTVAGDVAVNGGDVTTTAATGTVFNTSATTINAFGQATTIGIGSTASTLTLRPSTVVGTNATQNLYNTVATNLNFGGAATALVMGAATGIATISNATLTLPNATTVNVNGANPTLAGSSTGTLTFFNTNLTAVNAFGAATNILLGASTGITTIRNGLRVTNSLYDSANSAGTSGQFLTATGSGIGWTTISGVSAGTISTATRALTVDTTTAPSGTFYPGLFVSSTGTASTTVYVDAGISYVSNTDTLTLTGDLAVNGGDLTSTAGTFNLINANSTNVNFGGAATALVMGAATGIATISNATLTLPNATTVNVNGANPTLASSSTGTLTAFNTNITKVNAFQAATDVVLSATTGITTVRNKLTVGGNLEIDGNVIQASDGNTNITLTSNTLTTFAGDIRVNGNDIQASDGNVNITMTSNTLTEIKGDLQVTGNDIKSSTGATVLTLAADDASVVGDLTVGGNLYVNGSTTQVNTTSLTVEDTLVELGVVDGSAPGSDLNKDLGLLFNYYTTSAKKAAVFWDDSASRIVFADDVTESSSVLTVAANAYASIEIEGLWVNDCAGQSQVITCSGTTRYLENITVDAGTF